MLGSLFDAVDSLQVACVSWHYGLDHNHGAKQVGRMGARPHVGHQGPWQDSLGHVHDRLLVLER